MKYQPLVSVIITTFQRSEFLIRAVNSVLNQSYKNIEIIIVDDNDDNDDFRKATEKNLEKYISEGKLLYVTHEINKGVNAARNTGIKKSKGSLIALLDDDDEWLQNKLESQVELITNLDPNVGIVGSYWRIINEFDNSKKIKKISYRGDLSRILGLNHFSPPSTILIRKEFLESVGCFDETFRLREDIELYYRLSFICSFDFVEEVLVNYYFHPNSISVNYEKKLKGAIQFFNRHSSSIKNNRIPWSEINENIAELYAVNGKKIMAMKHFAISFINRPFYLPHYLKAFYVLMLNANEYRNKRNFK